MYTHSHRHVCRQARLSAVNSAHSASLPWPYACVCVRVCACVKCTVVSTSTMYKNKNYSWHGTDSSHSTQQACSVAAKVAPLCLVPNMSIHHVCAHVFANIHTHVAELPVTSRRGRATVAHPSCRGRGSQDLACLVPLGNPRMAPCR